MSSPHNDALILCYDGSTGAKHAIQLAGSLFPGEEALVLTVWQPLSGMGSFAWAGTTTINLADIDHVPADDGCRIAEEGRQVARDAGLAAEAVAVEAPGPVWQAIVKVADRHRPAVVVMGSRGLSGVRSMLIGSVSNAVIHHAHQPTLVVPPNGNPSIGTSPGQ